MHFISIPDTGLYNITAKNDSAASFVVENSAPPVHGGILLFSQGQQRQRIFYLS